MNPIPWNETLLPVGAAPMSSAVWVPSYRQRNATVSPSEITSSSGCLRSGRPVKKILANSTDAARSICGETRDVEGEVIGAHGDGVRASPVQLLEVPADNG